MLIIAAIAASFYLIKTSRQEKGGTDNLESRIGIIKPLGISIYMEGTHILQTGDQKILLEPSDKRIILDDYLGKRVTVSGEVRKTVEDNMEIMKVGDIKIME